MGSLFLSSSPLDLKRCPEFGLSGISAGLIDLPVIHEDPPCHAHNDADFDVNAPLPCSAQIGVRPQYRSTPASLTAVNRDTK